jgi:type II pantothenate kinase
VGTSIGSSTFWGILRLMGFFSDPTEAILSALKGDSSNVDMSVGDIYGGSYPSIGLKESMIASSFGRLKDLTSEEIANVNK